MLWNVRAHSYFDTYGQYIGSHEAAICLRIEKYKEKQNEFILHTVLNVSSFWYQDFFPLEYNDISQFHNNELLF